MVLPGGQEGEEGGGRSGREGRGLWRGELQGEICAMQCVGCETDCCSLALLLRGVPSLLPPPGCPPPAQALLLPRHAQVRPMSLDLALTHSSITAACKKAQQNGLCMCE